MTQLKPLFSLRSDKWGAYDGSIKGLSIRPVNKVKSLGEDRGFRIEKGFIEIPRDKDMDEMNSFTLEATITPNKVKGARQNIMEAQSPAIALFIDANGRLVGSINTTAGWKSVNSGNTLLKEKVAQRVRFTRDDQGNMEIEINEKEVGAAKVPGPIKSVGTAGFKIGTWVNGRSYQFVGDISDVQIRKGATNSKFWIEKQKTAEKIGLKFKSITGLKKVFVNYNPDTSYARLQPIKDIMNAAGVEKLSDLTTLKITQKTVMTPGKIMVAARKPTEGPKIDWGKIAKEITRANTLEKREYLAKYMTNRNSVKVLNRFKVSSPGTAASPTVSSTNVISSGGRITNIGSARRTSVRLPVNVLSENPTLKLISKPKTLSEFIKVEGNEFKLVDKSVIKNLEASTPATWPALSGITMHLISMKTIPVNSAVIIANTLDLTNTELVIEPEVETLYIIAEKIICGNNAKITWKRPNGSTPPRADDPSLNGRGWSGVHTKPNSKDGLDGEDGRSGTSGINGSPGVDAPNLEIWVKDMSAMPNLDLNGEDGIKGGRGQRGGRGGNGADGHVGKRAWIFVWFCTERPGDGGNGGDGGDGGKGGRGGNGGNGGNITIGVLDGTLETTVTSRAFKIKNQGGQKGRGGDGGEGGNGGYGGRSGVGETCKDAKNGANGAKGQRGRNGDDAANMGEDGEIRFFEFSEDAWEEMLLRPWISELSPEEIFPGNTLTIRGSHFSSQDRVIINGSTLVPTINADESVSVVIPTNISGGGKEVFIRRQDGTESNRLRLNIKPQLDAFSGTLNPGADMSLSGRAFLNGASVLVDGNAIPATVSNANNLTFTMPGTGGTGTAGGSVSLQVRNPDGMVSNSRTATIPQIVEVPFTFGVHNLPFSNFDDGVPSWSTYEDTFGAAEIWHEQLDPIFGHPILTAAFYGLYHYFLKGESNGGLATGFCTSLASYVADKFWLGQTDTHTVTKASIHKLLTAVHGKLLSRESLIHFHDQSREGLARVERTFREIERTFLTGCDRNNAPLLFFIPQGAIWDSGYIDKLGSTHCIMPYKFVYPNGHPGPQLSADSSTTITDPDSVEMYCWDCNHPESANCRLVFRRSGGNIHFDYFPDSTTAQFRSTDGMTLGMMRHGQYMLSDHDLPFSGPLGLTTFIIDFLLSPADLQVTDETGLRTGRFGSQILSEITDSHPCYLLKGVYMLPVDRALTRRIVGMGSGKYTFNSINPNNGSIVIEDVQTQSGHEDILSVNADYTQVRFSPCIDKTCSLTIARQVGDQVRAISVSGIGGKIGNDIDVTISPELSLMRIGNRSTIKNIDVKAFSINKATNTPVNKEQKGVRLPTKHDLVVAISDWNAVDLSVETVSF